MKPVCPIYRCVVTVAIVCFGSSLVNAQDEVADAVQLSKDTRTVETLLRLKSVDPNSNPKLKAAVSRYLESVKGTPRFLEVVEELKFTDAAEGLMELALANSSESIGVQAARSMFRMRKGPMLIDGFRSRSIEQQQQVMEVLGGVGNRKCCKTLLDWMQNTELEKGIRKGAMEGLLRSRQGQENLVALIEQGRLPEDLIVVTAAAIVSLNNEDVISRVSGRLPLPESADAQPLPPLDTLVRTSGDAEVGRQVFVEKGTCAKCHVVGADGKEVGPNLSEIGSKLSREAMFLSILDPNAGISHNFETYFIELIDGEIVTGILLSDAQDEVTVKTAEALVRNIDREEIEVIEKQKVSLMPDGLQKNLTVDELVGLVDYLMTLKKVEK